MHGLWFGAAFMAPMARRLEKLTGLPVRRINYRSTRGELGDHADRLHEFANQSDTAVRHLVGHSLGGLVILKMLSRHPEFEPGRVVFLGVWRVPPAGLAYKTLSEVLHEHLDNTDLLGIAMGLDARQLGVHRHFVMAEH